jgi:two-component SAPR family response regulator
VIRNPKRLYHFALIEIAKCISIKVKTTIFQTNVIVRCVHCDNSEWDDSCDHYDTHICCSAPPYIERLLDGELLRQNNYKFVRDERKILEILIISFLRIECTDGHHCTAKKWLEHRVEYCSRSFVYRRYILNLNEETEPTFFFHMMGAFEQAMSTKVIKNGRTGFSKS